MERTNAQKLSINKVCLNKQCRPQWDTAEQLRQQSETTAASDQHPHCLPLVQQFSNIYWKSNGFFYCTCISKHLNIRVNKVCLSKIQGPVVQSIVSLTSSLRIISLTVLADSIHNFLIFFAENMPCKSYSHFFFQQKNSAYLRITRCKF